MSNADPPTLAAGTKDAVAAVLDVIKLETTLATGVLAFSIGLTTSTAVVYSAGMKPWIVIAWLILAISVAAGVFALFYAPDLYRGVVTLGDQELIVATITNQLGFVFGSLAVAAVLIVALVTGPARDEGLVRTPTDAVRAAASAAHLRSADIKKVATVEIVRGTDPARLANAAWHVQFERYGKAPSTNAITLDVYVDPVTAKTYVPGG